VLIHPLVVHFPVALWLTSTFFDVMSWRKDDALHRRVAYWLVGLGLLGAAMSIAFGWIDLVGLERQGVGTGLLLRHRVHGLIAYAATALYLANFVWRWRTQNRRTAVVLALSFLGAILTAIAGYLGGEIRGLM
jgi:uncharacterized membrane protein